MLSVRCLSVLSVSNVRALWPNGWTDQDETWHAGRSRPWPYCVAWGPSSPPQKAGELPPIFGPFLLWPIGWMHQDATWYGVRPKPRRLCVRWGPSCLPKRGRSPPPPQKNRPMFIVAKRLHLSRWHSAWRQASAQATLCWMGTQHPLPKKGTETPPQFSVRRSAYVHRLSLA